MGDSFVREAINKTITINKDSSLQKNFIILFDFQMKLESNQIMFFVDDFKVAQQILMADKRITTNDNWRVSS